VVRFENAQVYVELIVDWRPSAD